MGIINCTPDSFYAESRAAGVAEAVETALRMQEEGAAILDIGGESTRPGSAEVGAEQEAERVVPVVTAIRRRSDIPISVDTRKATVAEAALEAGANIVNDISALTHDPGMVETVRARSSAVVLMHMQGTPENMQHKPHYDDVVAQVLEYLKGRAHAAIAAGVDRDRIVIDPGIGFGKRLEHNLLLLRHLPAFTTLGFPVLVGASRKSFIGMVLSGSEGAAADVPAEERGAGSLAVHCAAVARGASIVRVHDVSATVAAVRVLNAVERGSIGGGG